MFIQWILSYPAWLRMSIGLLLMLVGIRVCWLFAQAELPLGTATLGGLPLCLGITVFALSVLDDETLDLDA